MQYFELQCQDDDDFVEDEYFFDMGPLPKTAAEADQIARHFKEEAARWGNDDDVDEAVSTHDDKDLKDGSVRMMRSVTME